MRYVEPDRLIAESDRVIDGLGHEAAIRHRLEPATGIILLDTPLRTHVRLMTERRIDRMPGIRTACAAADQAGKPVIRLTDPHHRAHDTAAVTLLPSYGNVDRAPFPAGVTPAGWSR